jgi:hypothetical protein
MRLNPETVDLIEEMEKKERKEEKKNKKLLKSEDPNGSPFKESELGRGVETMFRNIYRTQISLSSIADNKAHIMLSINAIIVSIVLSNLVKHLEKYPQLRIPTFLLLGVCLLGVVFAILTTRPKVTRGEVTLEDIRKKRANLLFFGNFYKMTLEDYQWGMMEMLKDTEFLYSTMTRDLYYMGIVLAKKYQYLRICYGIFMYGLILAVLLFAVEFLINIK